jgi:hypothetical protein
LFKGVVDTVYCGVALTGVNGRRSRWVVSSFAVGSPAPANPITRLDAVALDEHLTGEGLLA